MRQEKNNYTPRITKMEPSPSRDSDIIVRWSNGRFRTFQQYEIDSLREYFTCPTPLTPRQRAAQFLADNPGLSARFPTIIDALAIAIEDAARHGVDWEDQKWQW